MYIRTVKIENVRGFSRVNLDFTRPDGSLAGWTVLAGPNGSGKSTLLKALALAAAGPDRARVLQESFKNWIRTNEREAWIKILLAEPGREAHISDLDSTLDVSDPEVPLWAALRWDLFEGQGQGQEPNLSEKSMFGHTADLDLTELDWRLREGPWGINPIGWFIVGYGPYRRLTNHSSTTHPLTSGPDRIAGLASLFREDASLIEGVAWLREIYLRRLENKPGASELEQTILSFLNDRLLPRGFLVENIDSDGLWVQQFGVRLHLGELSDGYQTTAALVMNIVQHLHRCYGSLRIEPATDEEGGYLRILHEGVVLIDEVDLHLHVSWQKRIGFWLKRHFPNIQFIVTTHSPFVCQAADPGGLIRLPAPGEDRLVEHVSESLYNTVVNGSIDDAVLTELFGLETPYSQDAERLRERVAELEARLQTGKVTDKERNELRELRSRLPNTLSSDVEQALRKLASEG